MRSAFALILATILCAAVVSATPFSNCGKPGDIFQVNNVVLTPSPPQRGVDANITVGGNVAGSVAGGSVQLSIVYANAGITVFSKSYDLCTLVNCPASGSISGTLTVPGTSIPSFAPAGAYTGTGLFQDLSGNELACISVSFNL